MPDSILDLKEVEGRIGYARMCRGVSLRERANCLHFYTVTCTAAAIVWVLCVIMCVLMLGVPGGAA